MRKLLGSLLVLALLSAACRRPADEAPQKPPSVEVPEVVVTADRSDLLFTWLDGEGRYHDVSTIDEIPEAARAQVLVRDLSRSPDELRAADFLYIADLRSPGPEGRFPCGAVSRRAFERRGAREVASKVAREQALEDGVQVVIYTTDWCGVCQKAKSFLAKNGVSFLERDLEKDPEAEGELQAKAAAAGLRPQGVPVLDVAGELMMGFDPNALLGMLKHHGIIE